MVVSPSWGIMLTRQSEGLLRRFVNLSYTLSWLTVTKPMQPDIKLRAFMSLCILTHIRDSSFHDKTDGEKQTVVKWLCYKSSRTDHWEKRVMTDFLRSGSVLYWKGLKGKPAMISSPASLVIATTAIKATAAFGNYAHALISSVGHSKGHSE